VDFTKGHFEVIVSYPLWVDASLITVEVGLDSRCQRRLYWSLKVFLRYKLPELLLLLPKLFHGPWTVSGTTRVSRYQKGKTRKVKPIGIYWSKR